MMRRGGFNRFKFAVNALKGKAIAPPPMALPPKVTVPTVYSTPTSSVTLYQPPITQRANRISAENFFGAALVGSMACSVLYMIYILNFEARDRDIIGNRINGLEEKYEKLLEQREHGSLPSEVVRHGDKKFLKKAAHDRAAFLREFVIATALNALLPESQPGAGILHEPIEGTEHAKYCTLSEMKPNSIDLEDFILQPDWKDKLQKKPMVGLETSLALIGMIAGQQDCKFANMVITEYADRYEVGLIDFELTGPSFWSIYNRYECTTDMNYLLRYIRELQAPSEYNTAKYTLSNDKRAEDFVKYALENGMQASRIEDLYRKMATTDFITPAISKLQTMYDSNTGVVSRRDIRNWEAELGQWQARVRDYVKTHALEQTSEPDDNDSATTGLRK